MKGIATCLVVVVALCHGRHLSHRSRVPVYPRINPLYQDPLLNDPLGLLYPQFPPTITAPTTTTTTTTPLPPRSPINNLTPTDDQAATNIGVKVPPESCIITFDQFQQNLPGRNWIGIYSIDDDENLNPGIAYKIHLLWTVTNDTTIRRRLSLWDNITKKCLYADGMFVRETSTGRAIFRSSGGNLFAAAARKDYFVSSDPANYVIFYICYDTDKIRDGRCITSEIFLVVKDQRPQPTNGNGIPSGELTLNDIPWGKIESDFKDCLGQQFVDSTDPQINWVWINPECPVPGTQAYESGIAAQNG